MRKVQEEQKMQQKPKNSFKNFQMQNRSIGKKQLAQRLFDKPITRQGRSSKRPRIFSNQVNKSRLLPTIVKEYQKKNLQQSIQLQNTNVKNSKRFKTQTYYMQQLHQNQKLNSMKKIWAEDHVIESQSHISKKNLMNRNKLVESRLNRTLKQSQHVMHLMQKMRGNQEQSRIDEKYQEITPKIQQIDIQQHRYKTEQNIQYKSVQGTKFALEQSKQINMFIRMTNQGEISDNQFYYMLKIQSNDYYNMQFVTYQTVTRRKLYEYFTLSGHGITRFEQARPIEFTSLQEWDKQRSQFNLIKQLLFFKKFRKWKSLKKWITILSREKMSRIRQILSEKMFSLNSNYRVLLLNHMNICYDLQHFKCIEIPNQPLTITEFCTLQNSKKNNLILNLKQCSETLHQSSEKGFRLVVEQLKAKIIGDTTQQQSIDKKQQKLDDKTQVFTQLGFPSFITYGSRSMIRTQFIRFLRLAYLLDFIMIESLGKMFIGNIIFLENNLYWGSQQKQIGDKLIDFNKIQLPTGLQIGITCNNQGGRNIYQENIGVKPLFNLQVSLELENIKLEFQQQQIVFAEINKTFFNFDLQGFMKKSNNCQEESLFTYDQDTILSRRYQIGLSHQTMKIKPNKNIIYNHIIDLFTDTLDSIQIINRWAKSQEFRPYLQALEQWDDIIGQNWDKKDQKFLTPINWIRENKNFKTFKQYIKNSINQTYLSVQKIIHQHDELINSYLRLIKTPLQQLKDPSIIQQSIVFNITYKKMIQCQEYMNKFLLEKADVYMYTLDFQKMKKYMLNSYNLQIKQLCNIYASIIKDRSFELKGWLNSSISQLSGPIIRIEQYVRQKTNLDRILSQIAIKKDEISNITKLLELLNTSKYTQLLNKSNKDQIYELSNLSINLFMVINDLQSQLPKYIDRFRKEIKITLQKFQKQLDQIKDLLLSQKFIQNVKNISNSANQLNLLENKMNQLNQFAKKYRKYQEVLEITQFTNFNNLKQIKINFNTKQKIFNGIINLTILTEQWKNKTLMKIDVKQLSNICDGYMKDLLVGQRIMPQNAALSIFRSQIFVFKDAIPVISALRCPYLELDDYHKIERLLNTDINLYENEQLKLGIFLKMPYQSNQQQIIEVSIFATQYYYLKKQLDNFENQWIITQLKLKQYKQTSSIIIIYDVQELINKLDQSLAIISNLLSNRYIGPLRQKAQKLNNDIIFTQEIIQKMIECQRKWVYLENIFAAQDIKKQLMTQANYFTTADKFLKNLTKKMFTKPLIIRLIRTTNIYIDLTKILELLEEIQKKLQDYLEIKRRIFSRFYFISNDQLVEILANSTNINIIQKHINKLFQGIYQLYIDKQTPTTISAMLSTENQLVRLSSGISMRNNIQIWLNNLQKEMIQTMKRIIRDGNKDYINAVQKTRIQWILNHKSQVVQTDNQIIWCNESQQAIKQQAIRRDSLYQWHEILLKQLNLLTELIRTDLKPLYHKIAVSLITADVHNRDIIFNLIGNEIQSINEFGWQQQLKYYMEQTEICLIRQVNALMDYGYQYLGPTSRLVITPLTDKCWITITSAIIHHLGAAPAGPAGTGKTESTKDLSKGLARICIVFNCSDQITAPMMSKLFSGLAQQGAWTCLDQFNRIDIEVLSVIAQQLFSIRVSLKTEKNQLQFEGKTFIVKKNFGVFITMNPGYAGRTQLPDNLKSLFRPVSMMIPDYTMIAQIMLFAQGFNHASQLSKKMVQLYKLSSEQLSQQKHYDFGLRAVKSLLVMAGQLKRNDNKCSQEVVLIKAMKHSNVPKFLSNDIELFSALISDLFPNVKIQEQFNKILIDNATKVVQKWHYGNTQNVITKIIQLHQVMNIRFGVMIVGGAGVGKTSCYGILKETMQNILNINPDISQKYYHVTQKIINPKSVSMGQLYGQIDILSQEWTDGVLSSIIRECNNCQEKNHYWIILDGPVDSLWIENLNTVLDDNLTLCLANGERIKLRLQLRMLFQVENLQAASPATVSRCGMVYLSENKNYLYYITSQIQSLELIDDYKNHLINLFNHIIPSLLEYKINWFQPISTINLQIAQCLILLIKYFLKKNKLGNSFDENIKKLNFISAYCIIWSVGSSIESSQYSSFELKLRSLLLNIFLPKTQTIFDFIINPENFLSFVGWQSKLNQFEFTQDIEFNQIIVPTIDTLKYKYITTILVHQFKSVILTGQSGVGKTSLMMPFLFNLKQNGFSTIFLNFSAKTKPKQTQLAIESKLTKKAKNIFGAHPNQSIIIFIDDINLPELQSQGAQPTIQLLRQYIDYKGFYDRNKLFWKQITDTTLVSCGATPGGGRNKLNTRFTRHSMIICLPQPSQHNLKKIFGSILKGFLTCYNFNDSVKKLAQPIVSATLDFHRTIKTKLLPIPSKFHYLFNLRDISKVFQGILQCSVDTANTKELIYKLWVHEMQRIFGDRLNTVEDKNWFIENISKISKLYGQGIDRNKIINEGNGINFSYIFSIQTQEIFYELIQDTKKVQEYLECKIYQYNIDTNSKLELVFFKQAIEHILRISRVLCQPRGNAMLIGVGGSGKQSLSKISAYISNCQISQLEIGKGYNSQSFRNDLQKIALETGVQNKKICFLFLDTKIVQQDFLQSINNMLNIGQVPNLFRKKQEIDDIMNRIRPMALKMKKVDSPQSLWSFFISKIRSNLHIVLCMSPAGDALRIRCRKFPSLINCCTINWFNSWTSQALTSVARRFISKIGLSETLCDSFTALCTSANLQISTLCSQYYQYTRRKVETTPKTFLDQLQLFQDVIIYKNKSIQTSMRVLSNGLEKLYSTNDIVVKLKIQMTKLQPQLAQQCIKTDEFLKRLAVDKQQADQVEEDVEAEAQDANQKMVEIKIIKQQAQSQLGKAMPMLLQAEEALKKINKGDITEIKGYTSPHPIVQMVMQAVCVLLNEKTDWGSIKVVMMQMNFLDRLKNYEKNSIPDNILKKLKTYTSRSQFEPNLVGQKNLASKSLCMWCRAIDNYAKVARQVEPKKRKLFELQKMFEDKSKILFIKQKQLDRVKQRVMKLQRECQDTLDFKNKLQNDLDLTIKRLERAQKLTILLKDQGLRWNSLINNYKIIMLDIPAQAYLSSLYLSYLGPFTGQYRQQYISKITTQIKENKITIKNNFNLTNTMYDQLTVRDWILQGLPNDPVSVDNAIIAKKGKRYPLLIDPQNQGNKWLKTNEKKNSLQIINFEETYYLKNLQTSVQSGYSVLIEDVQQNLESSIDSLLQKKIQQIDGIKMIMIGDKKTSFNDNFYLYMTTRIANPKFLAQVFNKATVINFSITQNGLRDQLLASVCKLQKPEIEQQRDSIIVKVATNRRFLKESQDKILKMLAQSKGMILDDIELITTLEQSKVKAKEVEKDLQRNSIIEEDINQSRSIYLPVAIRATILYFVIAKLSVIEPMYEFSLTYVKKLYLVGLQKAQFHSISDLRVKKLNESVTKMIFTNISRALFEAHKKLFSFFICTAIKSHQKSFDEKQWQMFSKGAGLKPKNYKDTIVNPDTQFLSANTWFSLHKLSQIPDYTKILTDIKADSNSFKSMFSQSNIFMKKYPGKQANLIRSFSILLLGRIICPRNLVMYISQYVEKQIGKFYDQVQVSSVDQVLDSSTEHNSLMLFILSTGVDPTSNILNYCSAKGYNLDTISLGQGQGIKAQNCIERAKNDGSWVLLNNCHLSKSWLPKLEKIIEGFSQSTIKNSNFRLLLSSMPVNYFPTNILQNANKFTLEPPRGIKSNILRSFKDINQDLLNSCPNRRRDWVQCLYSLTFFHAVVQQRRKYGALGFNIFYDFNDSDLQMSLNTLKIFLNDNKQDINWQAIWYMIGQINYGGRVTDDWDRTCIMAILKRILSSELLLNNNEKFFYSDIEDYYCLSCVSLQDFEISITKLLPNNDPPQVFGLHPNANLAFNIQQSNKVLQCIQCIEPQLIIGEQDANSILQIIQNLSQLPQSIKTASIPIHLLGEDQKILPSMSNFLYQQFQKFNKLLSIITNSLITLQKAIKGLISMNQQLDQMLYALKINKIPKLWLKHCYETMKPLSSWFVDFKLRMIFLQNCLKCAPTAYWISCFFFPQGLLTAFLQTHARKTKIPIDNLSFKFKVTQVDKQKLTIPKEGGYVYGLFFQGGRWDSHKDKLSQQQPGKLNEPLPCTLFLPTENYEINQNQYNCPCYKTMKRSGVLSTTGQSTNFILGIHLNSKIEKSTYWTLRGTALLCQLNH